MGTMHQSEQLFRYMSVGLVEAVRSEMFTKVNEGIYQFETFETFELFRTTFCEYCMLMLGKQMQLK